MDDLDIMFQPEPSSTQEQGGKASEGLEKPTNAPPQGAPAAAGAEGEKAEESPDGDGTAEAEGKPPLAKEETKGVLPKELEPFKDLIESRKLDLTKPEGVAKLAQSYKEAEAFASRSQTHSKNSQDKATRIGAIMSGSIEDVNKFRKSQGLSEFKTDTRSHEDREKELNDLYDHTSKALKGDEASIEWLNKHFNKATRELDIAKAMSQANPSKSADQAFMERKRVGQTNFATAIRENKDAKAFFDELTEDLSPGGVFDSMGIDVLDAASTPERLAAFIRLGQGLHVLRNMEGIVKARVDAELDRQRAAKNAGPTGGKGKAKEAAPRGEEKAVDLTHLFS